MRRLDALCRVSSTHPMNSFCSTLILLLLCSAAFSQSDDILQPYSGSSETARSASPDLTMPNTTVLSITVSDFEVLWESTGNRINWACEQEELVDFYLIEKTINGQDFEPVVMVRSGEYSYTFQDTDFESASVCYRISTVFENGPPELASSVECAERPIAEDFQFLHAGVSRHCRLQLNTAEPVNLFLRIYDEQGRMVFERSYLDASLLQEDIDLHSLRTGLYTVVCILGQQRIVERMAIVGA